MQEDKPEEGRQYSLTKLGATGSWAASDVTAEVKLAETFAHWEREISPPPAPIERKMPEHPYRVGSIFRTSWGYDQTNVEYYQVVRETKASVWLREIVADSDGRLVYPVKDAFVAQREFTGEYGRVVSVEDDPLKRPEGEMHRKGRGFVGVKLDYVRNAWPYEGGGNYDTIAAGEAGH